MIYTSYYAKKLPEDFIKVSISVSKPKSYRCKYLWKPAIPDWTLVDFIKKGLITENEYKVRYLQQIEESEILTRAAFLRMFDNEDKNVVLLCWESPDSFCHRHILADYLNDHMDLKHKIKEYE
jgi:uncharacterized protein (DUF488 family)